MAPDTKHLEMTLDAGRKRESRRRDVLARCRGGRIRRDDCYRIGMSVREGVINAFHYGNQERPEKRFIWPWT